MSRLPAGWERRPSHQVSRGATLSRRLSAAAQGINLIGNLVSLQLTPPSLRLAGNPSSSSPFKLQWWSQTELDVPRGQVPVSGRREQRAAPSWVTTRRVRTWGSAME